MNRYQIALSVLLLASVNAELILLTTNNCKVFNFQNVCTQCLDGYTLDQLTKNCNKNQAQIILNNDNKMDVNQVNTLPAQSSPTLQPLPQVLSIQVSDPNKGPHLPSTLPSSPIANDKQIITISSSAGSGISLKSITDLNCKKKSEAGDSCLQCYMSFYFSSTQNQCVPVNPLCKQWNKQGHCLQCYFGYSLAGTQCKQMTLSVSISTVDDPNCFNYLNGKCVQCSYRFVFNSQGICTTVHPDCKTWDKVSGACLSCFDGYDLTGHQCIDKQTNKTWFAYNLAPIPQSNMTQKQIPNCAQYNEKSQCVKCAFRFYYQKGQCKSVSDLCKSWSVSDGKCTNCYNGYDLEEGACKIVDPFCTIKTKQGCNQCSNRYYLNVDLRCMPVSPLCKSYDPLQGSCTSCYLGYALKDKQCNVV